MMVKKIANLRVAVRICDVYLLFLKKKTLKTRKY